MTEAIKDVSVQLSLGRYFAWLLLNRLVEEQGFVPTAFNAGTGQMEADIENVPDIMNQTLIQTAIKR